MLARHFPYPHILFKGRIQKHCHLGIHFPFISFDRFPHLLLGLTALAPVLDFYTSLSQTALSPFPTSFSVKLAQLPIVSKQLPRASLKSRRYLAHHDVTSLMSAQTHSRRRNRTFITHFSASPYLIQPSSPKEWFDSQYALIVLHFRVESFSEI